MNTSKVGVVYTPERIAEYIAKTSIEKFLLEKININLPSKVSNLDKFIKNLIEKKRNDIKINNQDYQIIEFLFTVLKGITVLDPAVGEGQFLFAALKILENYFLNCKALGIINWRKLEIREYIISNNLFGVDIDNKAIETTKNRLILTLDEFKPVVKKKLSIGNIDANYKVGNALIGFIKNPKITNSEKALNFHYYDKIKKIFKTHKDLKKLQLTEIQKRANLFDLKPFHWCLEFPNIIKRGGFDIILQNPPYISNKELIPLEKAIYQEMYETPQGLMNKFGIFIERSIKLCHNLSRISYIVHNNIIRSNNYELLRKFLLENTTIEEIIDIGNNAFESITAAAIIIVLKPKPPPKEHKILIKTKKIDQNLHGRFHIISNSIHQSIFLEQENYNINLNLQYNELEIIDYIKENKDSDLGSYFKAKTCIATGNDKKFLTDYKVNDLYKKTLKGKNIGKYFINFDNLYVKYNPEELHRARDESIFLKPEKLIMKTISSNLIAAYDNKNYYPLSTCIAIISKNKSDIVVDLKYLLLLINSKLMNFYYDFVFNLGASLTTEISVNNINKLPIKVHEYYKSFDILSDIIILLNNNSELREKNKDLTTFFQDLIDFLVYTIFFYQRFQEDGLKIDFFDEISQYFEDKILTSRNEIKKLKTEIQNDKHFHVETQKIKTHPWVKTIEQYFIKKS
ncbi:MAG: Eco57I restriction-modification methylase domain-containing protein [Promethearchaeota archaeon]